MNLMMHGMETPQIDYTDTLSKNYVETGAYEVVLANPPFTGSIDKGDVNEELKLKTTKSELLFIERIYNMLRMGGTAGIVIPQGVLFGSGKAFVDARKLMIEKSQLKAVISIPSGAFKPYAGVSTALLIFTKGGTTEDVFFYDMRSDGYSLDDKRNKLEGYGDLQDIITKYKSHCQPERFDKLNVTPVEDGQPERFNKLNVTLVEDGQSERFDKLNVTPVEDGQSGRFDKLNVTPVEDGQSERFDKHSVTPVEDGQPERFDKLNVTPVEDGQPERFEVQTENCQPELVEGVSPSKNPNDRKLKHFAVPKKEILAEKYDLSFARYKEEVYEEIEYEKPEVILEKLMGKNGLEAQISAKLKELKELF
jgi:type I restriction-modification system DNA methylase subunit